MYNRVKGVLTGIRGMNVYLETSILEWVVLVSAQTMEDLPSAGSEISLLVHCHYREDAAELYGFYTEKERSFFLELIKVSGIGPKGALKILSSASLNHLLNSIESKDVKTLSKVKGVGLKTAQKIILSLEGYLNDLSFIEEGSSSSYAEELIESLVQMGFDKKDIREEWSKLSNDDKKEEAIVMKKLIIALSTK